jgi:hypothetical protein
MRKKVFSKKQTFEVKNGSAIGKNISDASATVVDAESI